MGDRVKLPVFDVLGEGFSYSFKKLPSLFILSLLTTVIVFGPIAFLAMKLFPHLLADFMTMQEQLSQLDPTDSDAALLMVDFLIGLAPLLALIILGAILSSLIINTVIIRNITRGEALWLPKLNKNVLRYLGANLLVMILFIPAYLLLIGIIGGATIIAEESGGNEAAIVIPALIIGIIVFFYIAIRLSFIPVDALAQGRIGLSSGWAVTKGNVARVFGLILMGIILVLAISLGGSLLIGPLEAFAMVDLVALSEEAIEEDPTIIFTTLLDIAKTPLGMAYLLTSSILNTIVSAFMLAFPTFAYVRMTAGTETTAEE